ncbi:MAG: MBOAT family protein [Lachnospiraceae bacterium]|nr:MBOAT family protein [Lachnospiraceae bacterium]
MAYTSLTFYIFLIVVLLCYYIMPLRARWIALLSGSVCFYLVICGNGWWVLFLTLLLTYGAGLLIGHWGRKDGEPFRRRGGLIWLIAVCAILFLLYVMKNGSFLVGGILDSSVWQNGLLVPIGISFYTLQIVSYLTDIKRGEIEAEKNFAKYALFILFFPQIIQGPIPRYGQLAGQLYQGSRFDEKKFVMGMQLILWGFFLKLMIADKAAIVVNTVFDNPEKYTGCYVLMAGTLYSIQLYTDFLACVTISQGVAGLFGITLIDNFTRPYFATSIKEFWRRWHISLSAWLRDYIYIPLGGSRKGRIRKYANLVMTFAVSGIWHGAGYKFLAWGLLHAAYQIAGEWTSRFRNKCYGILRLEEGSGTKRMLQRIGVFFWAACAWVIFRADSLRGGLRMLWSLFTVHNPWIFFDDSLLTLGLDWKEWCILAMSMIVLLFVSYEQEKGRCLRALFMERSLYCRWFVMIAAVLVIMMLGTYGFGFDAQDFIYGGF